MAYEPNPRFIYMPRANIVARIAVLEALQTGDDGLVSYSFAGRSATRREWGSELADLYYALSRIDGTSVFKNRIYADMSNS